MSEDIHTFEETLKEHGMDACSMTWEALATNCLNKEVSGKTLKRGMEIKEYYKYIACFYGWVDNKLAKKRVEHSKASLEQRPEKKH